MTIYLNWRTNNQVETIDEFSPEKGQTIKEFCIYVDKMVKEYHMAGMAVYKSRKCTNEWKNKS